MAGLARPLTGQEERANMGRQRSGRGARYEVLETGKQARRRGLFGRRFLGHAERSPKRVERDEPKAQALLVLDVAGCHARQRHHDDTSMDGPVRYTFYQRAYQEQEGPTKLQPPRFLAGEKAIWPWCHKVGAPSAPRLGGGVRRGKA